MDKAELRTSLQKCLAGMPEELRIEKSRKACKSLISIPQFQDASVIMFYLSMSHEVDTAEAILAAWQLGKTVAVPKISWEQRHMIAVEINSLETGLSTGASGLKNPVKSVPVPFEDIDLVVVPGLGFDNKGNRLGRGAAFYDKFFARDRLKAYRCALAFSEQIVDSVPTMEHDQPMDALVTDEKIVHFNPCRQEAGEN